MMQRIKPHTFYDDYESDCIEIWDNIEALQELMKNLSVTLLKMESRIAQLEQEKEELEMNGDAPQGESRT